MSTISANTTFALNGSTSFNIGADLYTWSGGWISEAEVWSGSAGSTYAVTVNLSGSDWGMGALRFVGQATLNVVINDATTGSERAIDYLKLGTNGTAGAYGTSTVVLNVLSVSSLEGGQGVDDVTLGAGYYNSVDLQGGNDLVTTRDGWVGSIQTGDGTDRVTIGAGGAGQVSTGNGSDRVTANGSVDSINLGSGNNRATTGSEWVGTIQAYDGNDTVEVGTGGVDGVSLGSGNNTLTATGYVGFVQAYSGNDTVELGADGADSINVGGGENTVSTTTGWVASIVGYGGEDTVNLGSGGAGSITLHGGNDTVNLRTFADIDDRVLIDGSGGDDTLSFASVATGITFSLANTGLQTTSAGGVLAVSIERLRGGSGNDVLTGNSSNNTIIGGAGSDYITTGDGNDILYGSAGNDRLNGGADEDRFVFHSALDAATNVDRIFGFNVANDTIALDDAIFTALTAGVLAGTAFRANNSGGAGDSSDRIIYEIDTGELYYDSNGNASGGRVHFATLTANLSLTNADFLVV